MRLWLVGLPLISVLGRIHVYTHIPHVVQKTYIQYLNILSMIYTDTYHIYIYHIYIYHHHIYRYIYTYHVYIYIIYYISYIIYIYHILYISYYIYIIYYISYIYVYNIYIYISHIYIYMDISCGIGTWLGKLRTTRSFIAGRVMGYFPCPMTEGKPWNISQSNMKFLIQMMKDPLSQLRYPLVIWQFAIENGPVEITWVFPWKSHGGSSQFVATGLPEGTPGILSPKTSVVLCSCCLKQWPMASTIYHFITLCVDHPA